MMLDLLLRRPDEPGQLIWVIYSLTLEEPHQIREIGLRFECLEVILSVDGNELRARRGRLCGAGLCMEYEICCNASKTTPWAACIGSPLRDACRLEAAAGKGSGIRLMFSGAGESTVGVAEVVPERGFLWASGPNGAAAWGGPAAAVDPADRSTAAGSSADESPGAYARRRG